MNQILSIVDIDPQTAIDQIYEKVCKPNYVPTGHRGAYIEILEKEYDRLRSGKEREYGDLNIRILDPGCFSCNNLQELVIEIMSELNVAADIFQIHDLDEIGRFGVMQTPALLINGKVKCAGRLPTRSKIEEWLQKAMD